MSAGLLLSMLMLGLASGVHCIGMCGGFVAAFSTARVIPIVPERKLASLLLLNAGRVTTYAVLGAASGWLGGELAFAFGAQAALYVLANIMLVAVGLHLTGATQFLGWLEKLMAPLWRAAQPLLRMRNAYVPGLAWGFMPCGLVYGALAAAALAGSGPGGAAAMLAYGLGTLPWLAGTGFALQWVRAPLARAIAGAGVLGFGVYGLAHASGAVEGLRGWVCS